MRYISFDVLIICWHVRSRSGALWEQMSPTSAQWTAIKKTDGSLCVTRIMNYIKLWTKWGSAPVESWRKGGKKNCWRNRRQRHQKPTQTSTVHASALGSAHWYTGGTLLAFTPTPMLVNSQTVRQGTSHNEGYICTIMSMHCVRALSQPGIVSPSERKHLSVFFSLSGPLSVTSANSLSYMASLLKGTL